MVKMQALQGEYRMPDRYGVIGHPIAHSKSPIIHRLFAEQTAQDIEYVAWDIPAAELPERVRALIADDVRGLNVTVPHKSAIVDLMDACTERARLAGAVNTVIAENDGSLTGDNTDGIGLIRDLQQNLDLKLQDRRILVLGAGGASRGIVPALLETGPKKLRIANRSIDRARELAGRFGELGQVSACRFDELGGQQFDVVINATSAGLTGDRPPFPGSIVHGQVVCYDLSYAMVDTPFIAWARSQGAEQTHQGWGMLVEQAAESFYLWRGVRPETGPVRRRLP